MSETLLDAEWRFLEDHIRNQFADLDDELDMAPYLTIEEIDNLPVLRETLISEGYLA